MSIIDIECLQGWVGRTETQHDVISAAPVSGLSASLDYVSPIAQLGEALPPCWHWLYFQDAVAASSLAVDGHARRGGFMPPVPLPRRMWAGSRLRFFAGVNIGDEARRVSTIASINHKVGSSGELIFVTLKHQIFQQDTLAIEEEQDLVYRNYGVSHSAAKPAPAIPQWSRELCPDSVLLFRYSALTFNSHRIHFDMNYATQIEGYTSLVVHAPLTATLLLDLLRRELPDRVVAEFEFRALKPLLEGVPLLLQGRRNDQEVKLWVLDDSGALAMKAHALVTKSELSG
ncbi:MAG: MaoC family dehydratase N-terminal domain-containing protein [Halioglobus sp.]|nr:MaoC family dehydratase N-terminal domain-containing protein [Halioglobus sp.]